MLLLDSQKTQLLKIVVAANLEPARFSWAERTSKYTRYESISVLNSQYFFEFSYSNLSKTRHAKWAPSREFFLGSKEGGEWDDQMELFQKWVENLKRELPHHNLWQDLQRQAVEFGIPLDYGSPSGPFSKAEYETVTRTLEVIQALLISYCNDLVGNQEKTAKRIQNIQAEIKKLKVAAENQDKKSWLQLAVGVLAGLAIDLALEPAKIARVAQLLRDGLTGIQYLINKLTLQ